MFGFEILDVIIGLAFIYLLCSLVCSAINEWIARLFALRAKDLEKEFGKMLDDNLKEKLYNHPLIKGITRSPNCIKKLIDWIKKQLNFKKIRPVRPSYIDPKLFSMALTDILMGEGENEDVFFKNLQDGISKGSVPALQTIVNSVKTEIANAKDLIVAFRKKVEDWFNTNMEQLSVWYKRKSRVIIFLIAVLLCAGLNIDTIMITKYLFQNETARARIVEAAAQHYEAQNPKPQTETKLPPQESPGAVTPQPTNNSESVTDAVSAEPKVEPKSQLNDNPNPPGKRQDENPMATVKKLQANLQELGLPIGWNCDVNQKADIRGKPKGWALWIVKLLGLFISALAISMGAPFWFDVLKKMIDIRKKITPAKK